MPVVIWIFRVALMWIVINLGMSLGETLLKKAIVPMWNALPIRKPSFKLVKVKA